eukprot:4293172-Pyramimonas_sp.AAC.1
MAQPLAGTWPEAPALDLTLNYLCAKVTRHFAEDMIDGHLRIDVDAGHQEYIFSKGGRARDGEDGGAQLTDTSFVDNMTAYARMRRDAVPDTFFTAMALSNIIV